MYNPFDRVCYKIFENNFLEHFGEHSNRKLRFDIQVETLNTIFINKMSTIFLVQNGSLVIDNKFGKVD